MFKACSAYSTAKFKLYLCMWVHTYTYIFQACERLEWCTCIYILHTDLSCTLVQLNTHRTLDISHMSKFITSTCFLNCQYTVNAPVTT